MAFGARQPDANCDTSHGKDESRAKRSASFHKSSSSGAHGALSKKRDAAVTQERHDSLPSRSVHPISSGRFETRVLPCAGNIGPDDDRKKPWFFRMQRRDAEIRLRKCNKPIQFRMFYSLRNTSAPRRANYIRCLQTETVHLLFARPNTVASVTTVSRSASF